jgi:hypothetical protein
MESRVDEQRAVSSSDPESAKPKKLIVCADGTWNDEDHARTNVAKLHRALQTWHVEGVDQWVCYVTGVGTTFGEAIRGGAFGYGLTRNILQGYYFLVDNYEPGDQLYFFGFSRGAYTVRSLAGFIRNSGLLKKENRDRVDEAMKLYRSRSDKNKPTSEKAEKFRKAYSYEPIIDFIGVWDTVGSLGIPTGSLRLLSLLFHLIGYDWRFHDPQLSSKVKYAYHAVSIHERRSSFVPSLWEKKDDAPAEQVLEQVWFPGVHCDVGGGYNAAGLSDEPLYWMMQKAQDCGLLFRAQSTEFGLDNAPDPFSRLHDSYSLLFRIVDFVLRKFRGEPRVYSDDPKYCADISRSALMLRHFSTKQEWPSSFVRVLDRMLTNMSLDDLKFPLKPLQPPPPKSPIRLTTAIDSRPIVASNKWNATGIHLNKGTRYRVALLGPLDVHDGGIHVTALSGWPWCWQRIVFAPIGLFRRRPLSPWFALIGSIDRKRSFRISCDGFELDAPTSGELFCYFNDTPFRYLNNTGSIRISVDTI